jgi:membrane-bound lytic murein transglycosylase MltF
MMIKKIIAGSLLIIVTLAVDNRYFDKPSEASISGEQMVVNPTIGTVVAYYENEYQRYAVDLLIQMNKLEQWTCLWKLWTRESNWRPKALNSKSGAYGIAQFMPVTWELVGHKRTSDGFTQVEAGLAYIQRKYGGNICKALASNLSRGWY